MQPNIGHSSIPLKASLSLCHLDKKGVKEGYSNSEPEPWILGYRTRSLGGIRKIWTHPFIRTAVWPEDKRSPGHLSPFWREDSLRPSARPACTLVLGLARRGEREDASFAIESDSSNWQCLHMQSLNSSSSVCRSMEARLAF